MWCLSNKGYSLLLLGALVLLLPRSAAAGKPADLQPGEGWEFHSEPQEIGLHGEGLCVVHLETREQHLLQFLSGEHFETIKLKPTKRLKVSLTEEEQAQTAHRWEYRPVLFIPDEQATIKRVELVHGAGGNMLPLAMVQVYCPSVSFDGNVHVALEVFKWTPDRRKQAAMARYAEATAGGKEVLRWPEEGKSYPFTLTTVDGKRVTDADFDNRVVILDFWAKWCGPCISEVMPALVKLATTFKDKLVVIGINFDFDEGGKKEEAVKLWTDKWKNLGVEFPIVWIPQKDQEAFFETAGIEGLPVVFLVRNGVLQKALFATENFPTAKRLADEVEKLVAD